MKNRIYNEKVDITNDNIKEFYDKRALKYRNGDKSQFTTVLLGDSNPEYAVAWDDYEKKNILPLLMVSSEKNVLDIGCGIGRWADTLIPICHKYVGTDFSNEMVKVARERFEHNNNCSFINVSFQSVFENDNITQNKYDVVIIAGVSMYLNENDLKECYRNLSKILNKDAIVYIEESVGINQRLTLNHIWSESLEDNYDAIYRTREEYISLMTSLIDECTILKDEYIDVLYKKETSETSHWYIVMKKK